MTVLPIQIAGLPFGGAFGSAEDRDGQAGRRRKRRGWTPSPDATPETRRKSTDMIDRGSAGKAEAEAEAEAGSRSERQLQDWTDESLLEAYVHGDRRAFRLIVNRYRDELLHFLMRFLGSRAAGEDVFQETFLQLHLSAESFDPARRLKPWLFTIAANKARDYHRKYTKRSAVSLSASIDSDGDGQSFVDLMEADLPGPDSPVLDAERSRLVKSVIDSMPAHLREILLLSYFQRMPYNQIADSLEIPLGTVKSRLHSAVAAFARSWSAARAQDRSHGREDVDTHGSDQAGWNEKDDRTGAE